MVEKTEKREVVGANREYLNVWKFRSLPFCVLSGQGLSDSMVSHRVDLKIIPNADWTSGREFLECATKDVDLSK